MMELKSRYFGRKNALAVGAYVLSTALVAGALFRNCGGSGGQDRHCVETHADGGAPVVQRPTPNNGVCEVALGEHDPSSVNYNEADCGRCGDGTPQPWEVARAEDEMRSDPAHPLPPGVRKIVCPRDFVCPSGPGNNERDVDFAVVKPVTPGSQVYTYVVERYNESCNPNEQRPGWTYCAPDCPTTTSAPPTDRTRVRPSRSGEPPQVDRPPPTGRLAACEGFVRSQALIQRVSGDVGSHATDVRNAVPDQAGQTIRVTVSIRVNGSGVPSVAGISPPGISPGIVNLGGVSVPAPGNDCMTSITVPVSPM